MGPRLGELAPVASGSQDAGSRNLGPTFLTITVMLGSFISCSTFWLLFGGWKCVIKMDGGGIWGEDCLEGLVALSVE